MSRPHFPRRQFASPRTGQEGLTLTELMVSITISMLVALAATGLLLSSKAGYTTVDDGSRLQDSGRYALDLIGRSVRQTAWEQWDKAEAPLVLQATYSANIIGLDAKKLERKTAAIDVPAPDADDRRSDVLALRFFGSAGGAAADNAVQDCAGLSASAPTLENADAGRGWSIFYVADSSEGIPELRCKYQGDKGWNSEGIVEGVESFQVLYGLDTAGNGASARYVNASAIDALDAALVLVGADAAEQARDKNRKTHWKKIVAIKIGLLLRGKQAAMQGATETTYDLFGAQYSAKNATRDPGTSLSESVLGGKDGALRDRQRKVFNLTIQLRNRSDGDPT